MFRQARKIWVRFLSVSPRLCAAYLLNLAGTGATTHSNSHGYWSRLSGLFK
jgi:hypothetical protein